MALFFPLGVPYRVPYRAPPNKAAGSPDLPLVGWVCNQRLSAWPGLAWLGLAGSGLAFKGESQASYDFTMILLRCYYDCTRF